MNELCLQGAWEFTLDPLRLNRKRNYIGPAWYRKVVEIPEE